MAIISGLGPYLVLADDLLYVYDLEELLEINELSVEEVVAVLIEQGLIDTELVNPGFDEYDTDYEIDLEDDSGTED